MSDDRSFVESFQGDLASLANSLQRLAAESIYPLNPQAAQAKACEILGYCREAQAALRNCAGLAARLAPAMPNPGHVETELRIWLEVAISVLGSVALDLPGGDDDDDDGVWVPRPEPTWPGSKDWFAKNENDLIEAADKLAGIAKTLGPCICSLHVARAGTQADLGAATGAAARIELSTPDSLANHAPDFSSVIWGGKRYEFNKSQARCIELLWQARENGGHTLTNSYLREALGSDADKWRLDWVFRSKGKMHEAFPAMIERVCKGTYKLRPPQ